MTFHKSVYSLLLLAAPLAAELRTDIEFSRPGGTALTLDAYVPEGKGPFPGVIIVHGGGWVRGTKTTYVPPLFDPLSKAGFAWFSINYRLAPDHRFPAPADDVDAAVRWVRVHAKEYKVDTKRLVLMGESAGGHLVSYAGARGRGDTKVAAVVSFYGVHDLGARAKATGGPGENVEKLLGISGMGAAQEEKMRAASPVTYVHKGMPPYLLIHGTADKQVPYDQSPLMCAKMKEAGVSCEVFTVEGAPHGIGAWEKEPAFQKYKEKMVEWLRQTLK
ncbi:MAG TPA: alpha/beta hydrolase [Bryobacteraceae bacterium]|nr:alpha/beta hydrolase [Bryobacteraceae bacterium]